MARPRNRGALLGRLLDRAAQPLYIVDKDHTIVFCNAACRRWLGAAADDLPGRRCAYHSSGKPGDPEALAAGLCPPPAAFAGKERSGTVSRVDEAGRLARRRARFFPTGDAQWVVLIVLVENEDLPEGTVLAEAGDRQDAAESERLHEQLQEFRRTHGRMYSFDRLVGVSPASRRARAQARLAAESRSSVTIVGPPGSGRQQLAKTIHFGIEPDRAGRLIPLDCSVLGGDLIRSTVTALAAAQSRSDGPSRNTLLLNGAENVSVDVQAELARIFFERPFPLRLIATSTCRLVESARRGEYSEGLAMGLGTIEIELPPLAARREDLPLLAQLFLEEINAAGAKQVGGFSAEAVNLLAAHHWPGNLDELAAVVAEAHEHARGPQVLARELPKRIHLAADAAARPRRREVTIQLDEFLAEIERELIERAMRQAKGNKTKAARLLGLNRPRLYRRLVQLGLIEAE